MKKYAFKLERLLKLKRMAENGCKNELGKDVRVLLERRDHLRTAEMTSASIHSRIAGMERVGKLDLQKVNRFQAYRNILDWAVRSSTERLRDQDKKVNKTREKLAAARCQTRVYERMRELNFVIYRQQTDREEMMQLSETAISRYNRMHSQERGAVAGVWLALMSALVLCLLIFVGALFFLGNLDLQKMRLITYILGYREDDYKTRLVFGAETVDIVHSATLERLLLIEKQYSEMMDPNYHDDENVITTTVLNKRRDILQRLKEQIALEKENQDRVLEEIAKKRVEIANDLEAVIKARADFEGLKQKTADEQFEAAQKEIINPMKSTDPEIVAKTLTNDQRYEDYADTPRDRQARDKAVAYIASYLTKLNSRQRAAVQESLGPKWTYAVNRHLETSL